MCRTFDKRKAEVHKAVEFKISQGKHVGTERYFAKKNKLSEL